MASVIVVWMLCHITYIAIVPFVHVLDLDVIRENLEAMSVYVRSPAQTSQSVLSATTGAPPIFHTSSSSDLKSVSASETSVVE